MVIPTGIICYTSDSGSMVLLKTDFTGNIFWSKKYSVQIITNCSNCGNPNINPVSDGGYVVTNGQQDPDPYLNYDYKILKLDSAFNIQWSKYLVSSPVEVIETADKDLALLVSRPYGWGVLPHFGVAKTDSLFNSLSSCIMPSVDTVFNDSIISSNINPTTNYSNGASNFFYPTISFPTIVSDTGCISPPLEPPLEINEMYKISSISIFPNPYTFQTTIAFHEEQRHTLIGITDLTGKEIKIINFTGKQLTIERGEMKAGIYFLQIIDENKSVAYKKIIIQ